MKKDRDEHGDIISTHCFRSGNGTYVPINNCPHCKGAVFPYRSWPRYEPSQKLFQCLHCSRLYQLNKNGELVLWVRNAYPGDRKGTVRHSFHPVSNQRLLKKCSR